MCQDFSNLSRRDHEILFESLAVVSLANGREPWDPIDYEEVLNVYQLEGLCGLTGTNTIVDFFEYYRQQHGVENLAQFKIHQRRLNSGPEGEPLPQWQSRLSRNQEDIVADVRCIVPFISNVSTLFDPEMWNYLGGEERMRYDLYTLLAAQGLSETLLEDGDRLVVIPDENCTHAIKDRTKRDLERLKREYGYHFDRRYELGPEGKIWDVMQMAQHASFKTLASEECCDYLKSGRLIDANGDMRINKLRMHVALVSKALSRCHLNVKALLDAGSGNELKDFINQKFEMILIRKQFGQIYDREKAFQLVQRNAAAAAALAVAPVDAAGAVAVEDSDSEADSDFEENLDVNAYGNTEDAIARKNHIAIYNAVRRHISKDGSNYENLTRIMQGCSDENVFEGDTPINRLKESFLYMMLMDPRKDKITYLRTDAGKFNEVLTFLIEQIKHILM